MLNIKKNLLLLLSPLIILGIFSVTFFAQSNTVVAQCATATGPQTPTCRCESNLGGGISCYSLDSNGAPTGVADSNLGDGCVDQDVDTCLDNNPLLKDIQMIVNFLAAGVALVVVVMIMIGGISYIMAGENSQAVVAAKAKIRNGITALIIFALVYSFFQWAVPGGIF